MGAKVQHMLTVSTVRCSGYRALIRRFVDPGECDRQAQDEIATLVGCRESTEDLDHTTARWANFLEDVAVTTKIQMRDTKKTIPSINAYDAGTHNDNGGIAAILSEHLGRPDTTVGGRILAVASN